MARVRALILTGHGVNCEVESAHAVREAGADDADIRYFSDLVAGRVQAPDYNLLVFPGGFLDGDDLGAAQAAALRWRFAKTKTGDALTDQLNAFLDAQGLVIGICNGFQLLVKLGLLPQLDGKRFARQVSLTLNESARFEDRWVHLKVEPECPCVFTKGLDRLYFPVRHGEGRLVPADAATLQALEDQHLVALRYIHPDSGEPTQEYPWNPNGAPNAIAGLCDPTGRILGLMPHPEAFNHPTNHPSWTRGGTATLGTELLANGVRFLREA